MAGTYPAFRERWTTLVFLQHIISLPFSVTPERILDQLADFWNGAQQVLRVKDCNLPIDDIFGGTQL